jgi:hypothetical protein
VPFDELMQELERGSGRPVIYLDASVALAQLLGEGRSPPDGIWDGLLISSSLLEYEVWNRIHARGLGAQLDESASALIGRLTLLELTPHVLARAYGHFPFRSARWTPCILPRSSSSAGATRASHWRLTTTGCQRRRGGAPLDIPLATV